MHSICIHEYLSKGWVEHDPNEIYQSVVDCMNKVLISEDFQGFNKLKVVVLPVLRTYLIRWLLRAHIYYAIFAL